MQSVTDHPLDRSCKEILNHSDMAFVSVAPDVVHQDLDDYPVGYQDFPYQDNSQLHHIAVTSDLFLFTFHV